VGNVLDFEKADLQERNARVNRSIRLSVLAVLSVACSAAVVVAEDHPGKSTGVEDAGGNLRVPSDYRDHYEFLGSWAAGGGKQIHNVYASPGTRAAFKRTGKFPDGTVLVKEQFEAETAAMTSGQSSHARNLLGWFVLVKNDNNRHSDNPLWGDGWGWSHFDFAAPAKTTASNYKTDCLPCHMPAQQTNFIYLQGYPSLR
jgi:Cytochrome P460